MRVDVLIVGGGLAGSVCAWQCHLRGYSVLVVDDPGRSRSSRVAGGLLNPITGKRLVVDPRFAEQRKEALTLYRRIEQECDVALYHDLPQWRLFRDDEQRDLWLQRRGNPLVEPWSGRQIEPGALSPHILVPFGGFEVPRAGWLDMPELIRQTEARLPSLKATVEDEHIVCSHDAIRWRDVVAKRAILCRGYRETFRHVAPPVLQHAKGEILLLSIEGLPTSHSINNGTWLLPTGDGLWKAGATYDGRKLDEQPTERGRSDLLARVAKLVACPVTVVEHMVGVRPIVKGRLPIVAEHPTAPLHVVNGLGSKGTLLAPQTSRQLVETFAAALA